MVAEDNGQNAIPVGRPQGDPVACERMGESVDPSPVMEGAAPLGLVPGVAPVVAARTPDGRRG